MEGRTMDRRDGLQATVDLLVQAGKGILAADESGPTIAKRLGAYKEQGARFAKWRAVYNVSDTLPGRLAIEANADALARYAAICQDEGVVPIVEPEVLMDSCHTLGRCTRGTLRYVDGSHSPRLKNRVPMPQRRLA
jgi:fructose-bisphosphate aldolase class 1